MKTVRKLLFGPDDPYEGWSPTETKPDLQGWNSQSPVFKQIIQETKPQLIVEVGTWKGASAITMAHALDDIPIPDYEIVCVDTWLGSTEFWLNQDQRDSLRLRHGLPTVYSTFLSNIVLSKLETDITPFPATSLVAARFFAHHKLRPNLVYVDASHDFTDVCTDIMLWHKLCPVVFGDDYTDDWPGVQNAVKWAADKFNLRLEVRDEKWILRK